MLRRGTLDKKTGYLLYTALFALLFSACFLIWLILEAKSPIRRSDGLEQHYISFVLVGRWIRSLFGGNFEMWNDSMGLGGDVFSTLFGAFTDPMYWISALVPAKYAEYLFDIMIVVKVYLSGLSFLTFCNFRKNSVWPSVAGAIVYTFSASMYLAFFESVCISWMYVLPLIMIGTIRLWEKDKHGLFVLSLTFAFVSQFYFAYMSAMVVLFYCIVRAVTELISKTITIKTAFIKALKFALFAGLSFGMALISILPVVRVILASDRMGVDYYMPLLYEKEYYFAFLAGFGSYFNMLGRDCYLGFSVAALVCVLALFLLGKGRTLLKTGFILTTIGLMVPFIGHVMNGMSYPSNRWVWAYVFVVSYIVTVTLPRLKELSYKRAGILLILLVIYGIFAWTTNDGKVPGAEYTYIRPEYYQLASIGTFVMALALLISSRFFKKAYPAICIALISISVVIPAYITFHPDKRNLFGDEITATTAYAKVTEGGLAPVAKVVGPFAGERIESFGAYKVRNGTWVTGVNSTDFYMNICNNYVESFMRETGLHKSPWAGGYTNMDSRTSLEALMGINYVVTPDGNNTSLSLGYEQEGTDVFIHIDDAEVHSSRLGVHSIANLMDKSISYEDYLSLDMQQRQQALARAVVLDGEYADSDIEDLGITDDSLPWTIESMEGVRETDTGFVAEAGNATMILDIDTARGAELYIGIEGLDFQDGTNSDSTLFFTAVNEEGADTLAGSLWFINSRNHMYGGITDWIVNMGRITEDASKIRVTFSRPGEYTISDIRIYARPVSSVEEDVKSIIPAALPGDINYYHSTNTYEMHVDVTSEKGSYLTLMIPYSEGWSLTANGTKQELLRADTGFMAVYLKPGSYDILLKYRTPGLMAGLAGTIVSACIYSGIVILEHRSDKKRKVQGK